MELQTQELKHFWEEKEKQIVEEAGRMAKEMARKELALMEFELFYEIMVPKESKEKAEKFLKKLREERWAKALGQVNGNEEDALFIYGVS